jgi:hypothetical protein
MPKIQLNPLFSGMSGKMGNIIFKTSRNGQTYIASRPKKSNAKPSAAQQAQRERFKLANAYAQAALAKHPRSEAEWDGRPNPARPL